MSASPRPMVVSSEETGWRLSSLPFSSTTSRVTAPGPRRPSDPSSDPAFLGLPMVVPQTPQNRPSGTAAAPQTPHEGPDGAARRVPHAVQKSWPGATAARQLGQASPAGAALVTPAIDQSATLAVPSWVSFSRPRSARTDARPVDAVFSGVRKPQSSPRKKEGQLGAS